MRSAVIALGVLVIGCSPAKVVFENTTTEPAVDAEVDACVKRGLAYFKEIGSYPTLNTALNNGRLAQDVALERCVRTSTAF